jgi:DNA-binding NarL/FixJ family response regulator
MIASRVRVRQRGASVSDRHFPDGAPGIGEGSAGIRVLLADDHPMVRTALAERLADEDDLTVVGLCEDGSQVVEAAARLHPDVVCMDLSMPVMDGFEATEAVRVAQLDVRVVVLTGSCTTRLEAAAAGADALVPKSAKPEELLRCVRAVAVGGSSCPYCL